MVKKEKICRQKSIAGFTLIEAVIYLALFTILIGGILTVAFNVFESANRDQTKIMVQEEGNFLVAKINKALSEARSFNVTGGNLLIEKWDGSTVSFELLGSDLNSSDGGVLNNSNVQISGLVFTHGNSPEYIRAEFTVSATTPNGMAVTENFFTQKYLRN